MLISFRTDSLVTLLTKGCLTQIMGPGMVGKLCVSSDCRGGHLCGWRQQTAQLPVFPTACRAFWRKANPFSYHVLSITPRAIMVETGLSATTFTSLHCCLSSYPCKGIFHLLLMPVAQKLLQQTFTSSRTMGDKVVLHMGFPIRYTFLSTSQKLHPNRVAFTAPRETTLCLWRIEARDSMEMRRGKKMMDRSSVFCFSNNWGREVGPLLTVFHWKSLCAAVFYSDFQGKYKMENFFQELTLCKWPACDGVIP